MQRLDYQTQTTWSCSNPWQSPINLELTTLNKQPLNSQPLNLLFSSQKQIQAIPSNSGIQFKAQGQLSFQEKIYQLERFHFHDGSEHLLNGQRLSCEIHLIFTHDTETLVLAILCQLDPQNTTTTLAEIYQENFTSQQLKDLLPSSLAYVNYQGTLTTPPLTPNINWLVLTTPLLISPSSFAAVKEAFPDNHRQVQPLNGRKLTYYC